MKILLLLLLSFNLHAADCPYPVVAVNVTPLEMGVDAGDVAGKEVVRCYDKPRVTLGKRIDPKGKVCVRNIG